jgi:hypothetical protein
MKPEIMSAGGDSVWLRTFVAMHERVEAATTPAERARAQADMETLRACSERTLWIPNATADDPAWGVQS